MSSYDDGWDRDKDGFWTKDGEQIAPWKPPYSEHPVDYSAEHDRDRDNFFETDERDMPPRVKNIIDCLAAAIVIGIALVVVAGLYKAVTWLVF